MSENRKPIGIKTVDHFDLWKRCPDIVKAAWEVYASNETWESPITFEFWLRSVYPSTATELTGWTPDKPSDHDSNDVSNAPSLKLRSFNHWVIISEQSQEIARLNKQVWWLKSIILAGIAVWSISHFIRILG